MKILHTADWHLGKRLDHFSRMEEQREAMEEIIQIADQEQVDAVIIAGDLYDTYNPSNEAIELFYKTLKRLSNNGKRAIIAIAGNHDSPERIEAPDPLARECGIILVGYPNSKVQAFELETGLKVLQTDEGFLELKLPEVETPLRLLLTPYANELRLKTYLGDENTEAELRAILKQKWQQLADQYCDEKGVNILMTHLFVAKKGAETQQEEPEGEKPILYVGGAQVIYTNSIPQQIQYTALGHLHRYQVVDESQAPVVYSSSPLAYSFSEAGQQKYVVILEAEAGKPIDVKRVELKSGFPLERKKFKEVEEAVQWLSENPKAWVELSVATENYLTGAERQRLKEAHAGIVSIIPVVSNMPEPSKKQLKAIDIQKSMDELFTEYFQYKHGQPPAQELIDLFKEVRGKNE